MLPLLVAAGVVALYILYVETIFKSSKCKANAAMAGKTVIITGVNTGIGKATAMELARRVARVILACHIQKKAELAISDIKRKTVNTDVLYIQLDLGSLQAVHSFTETFLKTEARRDLLINSVLVADGHTADGFAIEFGVNHLSHFLLTCLLLDHLKECTEGHVVTLGSMTYCWGNIDFDALVTNKHLGTGRYRVVKTELPRNCSLWQKFIIKPIARLFGRYFFCCAPQNMVAKDKNYAVAKKLWEVNESGLF
uniref:Dehydrogenase/reductase (SDR family) member 13a, tandem duplicate 2 n=1 Tax=Salmo trutta TaxID=8032 RepID=A0A673XH23_SALTR